MKKYPIDGARDRGRALRREMTEAERRIWRILRARQIDGYRFRRQVPLGRYIADFVCHEARVIVEVDGGQHDTASLAEAERSRFLQDEATDCCGSGTVMCWRTRRACTPRSSNICGGNTPTHPRNARPGGRPSGGSPIEGEGFKRASRSIGRRGEG